MKKFAALLALILISVAGITQPITQTNQFPNFQQFGTPRTLTQFNGAVYPVYGSITAEYTDTASANNIEWVRKSPGILIRVGNDVYMRNAAATAWLKITASTFGIDDVLAVGQGLTEPRTIQGSTAITAPLTLATNTKLSKALNIDGIITPPEITANTHNYNPTGLDSATFLRLSCDANGRRLTGIESSGSADGRILYLQNVGDFTIRLESEAIGSDNENRFLFFGFFVDLPAYQTVAIQYNSTLQKWLLLNQPFRISNSATISISTPDGFPLQGAGTLSVNPTGLTGNFWSTTGNSSLTGGNFFGTTNSTNIRFKVNNMFAGKLTWDSSTYFGRGAGESDISKSSTGFGSSALNLNTSGEFNSGFGAGALQRNTTGSQNFAGGSFALQFNTIGIKNTATGAGSMEGNTTGSYNTGDGMDALLHNTEGYENTGAGWLAWSQNRTGHHNVGVGTSSGRGIFNGNWNVYIGSESGYLSPQEDTVHWTIALGARAVTTKSYQMVLGNDSLQETLIYGIGESSGPKMLYYDPDTKIVTYEDAPVSGGSGTVESVATNNATGIIGGTITTTGTLSIDTTNIIATIAQVQHRIDSLAETISAGGGGTVTSVATNNGTGITGGSITSSGTLSIDTTNVISTIAQVQHRIDSLAATFVGGSGGIDDVLEEGQTLTANREVDLDEFRLDIFGTMFSDRGVGLVLIPESGQSVLGDWKNLGNNTVVSVDDASQTIILKDGSLSTAANGYVWTLSNNESGLGGWAPIPEVDTATMATILQVQHRIDSLAATIDTGGGTVESVDVAIGTTGTDINVSGSPITTSGTITINIPDAGASSRGVITTGAQTIAGNKTFTGATAFSGVVSVTSAIITNASGASAANMGIIGGTTSTSVSGAQFQVEGSTNTNLRMYMYGNTSTTVGAGNNSFQAVFGSSAMNENSTGTHNIFGTVAFKAPTITNAGATLLNTATVYIEGAATATVSGFNKALWVKSGMTDFGGEILNRKVTAPPSSVTDAFYMYGDDVTAGNTAPHFRTESGDIVRLYKETSVTTSQGIANALTSLGLLEESTLDEDFFIKIGKRNGYDSLARRVDDATLEIKSYKLRGATSVLTDSTLENVLTETWVIAIGDETTDLTTGEGKVTFRVPYAVTITGVRASVNTKSSSGLPTFDINENGTSILSTKLTIDESEKTSTTAATPAVISDASIADDAELRFDIDVAGTGAKGGKIVIYYQRQ